MTDKMSDDTERLVAELRKTWADLQLEEEQWKREYLLRIRIESQLEQSTAREREMLTALERITNAELTADATEEFGRGYRWGQKICKDIAHAAIDKVKSMS